MQYYVLKKKKNLKYKAKPETTKASLCRFGLPVFDAI